MPDRMSKYMPERKPESICHKFFQMDPDGMPETMPE
jgi:hypothetical protein